MIRPMGMFSVEQRTKDGFFNATALMKQWNETYPNKKRDIDNFWKSTNLVELMSEIAENELEIKSVDFTDLKKRLAKTTRGKFGGTWLHPVLFVKWAMYLDTRFEYHVLRFVADQMLKYRNNAGDAYKDLGSAVQKIVAPNFMCVAMKKVGEALNWIIFNKHEKALRNKHGNEGKMRSLFDLERELLC